MLYAVLTVAPVYLTSHCGGSVVMGQMLCFATPSSNFKLSGRLVEIDLVSNIESFVFNLCAELVKVVCCVRSCAYAIVIGFALPQRVVQQASIFSGKWTFPNLICLCKVHAPFCDDLQSWAGPSFGYCSRL
jgi:hypothetical protein